MIPKDHIALLIGKLKRSDDREPASRGEDHDDPPADPAPEDAARDMFEAIKGDDEDGFVEAFKRYHDECVADAPSEDEGDGEATEEAE